MNQKIHRRRRKSSKKVRNSQENEVNLIPFSSQQTSVEQVINKKNVNQLWRWDTLEDVKF